MTIKTGDIVRVDINAAQITLIHRAELIHMPQATGDSWVFMCTDTGKEVWTSEGMTITKEPQA